MNETPDVDAVLRAFRWLFVLAAVGVAALVALGAGIAWGVLRALTS